jgi:hypothetical protein
MTTQPQQSLINLSQAQQKALFRGKKSHLVQLLQRQTAFYCDQIVIYFEILEEFRSSLH